jgi:uncharacterized surface protein with fasciclin (FAS1) repeats
MKRNLMKLIGVFTLLVATVILYSCKKEIFKLSTTSDVNITGYLEENPEKYSLLLEILERSKTQGYLGAYGTYTLFAPTNTAVENWMKESGKSSLSQFQDEELLDLVKYHVVKDTLSTIRFTDGKIKTPTLFGEFLYTDAIDGTYRINKTALIDQSNIMCGNGVIHSIEKVLVPPTKNLAELIEGNPNYSIFTEALKITGFYDTLSYQRGQDIAPEKRFQTVIVHSDSLYNTMNIMNFDDLKAKYSTKNDPQDHTDSLWLYIAYHITNNGKFLEDIAASPSLYTLAPKEIISTRLDRTTLLLNETLFNGVLEPGAAINRAQSDNMAVNGVMHEATDNFYIKVRRQTPVYWELGSEPETIAALGSAYHNATKDLVVNSTEISDAIRVEDPTKGAANQTRYDYWGVAEAKRPRSGGDYIAVNMCSANSARLKWIEFKTPYLVKGRYKVWICYVQQGNGARVQVSFNPGSASEQVLPNIVATTSTLEDSGVKRSEFGGPNADNLMLAQGYKRYMATTDEYSANGVRGLKAVKDGDSHLNVGRLAGIINVESTDRHVIRLTTVSEGRCLNNNLSWIDMIHLIPADDTEQNYPRFHVTPGELL